MAQSVPKVVAGAAMHAGGAGGMDTKLAADICHLALLEVVLAHQRCESRFKCSHSSMNRLTATTSLQKHLGVLAAAVAVAAAIGQASQGLYPNPFFHILRVQRSGMRQCAMLSQLAKAFAAPENSAGFAGDSPIDVAPKVNREPRPTSNMRAKTSLETDEARSDKVAQVDGAAKASECPSGSLVYNIDAHVELILMWGLLGRFFHSVSWLEPARFVRRTSKGSRPPQSPCCVARTKEQLFAPAQPIPLPIGSR